MLLKCPLFLAIAAMTAAQAQGSPVDIVIEKITKVLRPGDVTGRNHSIAISIGSHVELHDIDEWNLILNTLDKKQVTYTLEVNGTTPSIQRDFVFEGNLLASDAIALQAKNETKTIAAAFLTLNLKDLGSNVAWVGAAESSSTASMRVLASESLKEIMVDGRVCKYSEDPCYFIMPKPKPKSVKRCVNLVAGTKENVEQCDETVMPFNEISPRPKLDIQDHGTLRVGLTHNTNHKRFEVVAFDSEDRTNVFSKNGYGCGVEVNTMSTQDHTVRCTQKLILPDGKTDMMVLVVALDANGAVYESSLQYYNGNAEPEKDMTGVIVGAVIGSLIGIALIVLVVVFILKKKGETSSSQSGGSKVQNVQYSAAATTETQDP